MNYIFFSADKLRTKSGRTMVARAAAGALAIFAEVEGKRERSRAKIKQPVVLPDLQGKGHERKEAFLLKAFWLLCGYKVTGPPAAKSGSAIDIFALYNIEIVNVVFVLFVLMSSLQSVVFVSQ